MSLEIATTELRAALDGLREEHTRLSQQILSLESFLADMGALPRRRGRPPKALASIQTPKRRGRPPKAASAASSSAAPSGAGAGKRKRPNWSSEAREAARKRMQEYWAKRRKS